MQKPVSRRVAREAAFQFLFSIDNPVLQTTVSESEFIRFCENFLLPHDEFSWEIVTGTVENADAIDAQLRLLSTNWKLERMPRVDRTILRLFAYEILFRADIPKTVSINESLEMAKKFGEADSTAFVNGILDKISGPKNTDTGIAAEEIPTTIAEALEANIGLASEEDLTPPHMIKQNTAEFVVRAI